MRRIGSTGYREISPEWPQAANRGRTDLQLEAATDPSLRQLVLRKPGQFIVRIELDGPDGMREALATHGWRDGRDSLKPYTVDIDAGTVEGVPTKMLVMLRGPRA